MKNTNQFKIQETLTRLTIAHHLDADGTLWGTERNRIVKRAADQTSWQMVARFPFCSPRDYFGWSRPTARAMRADKCNLFVNTTGNLLAIRGGVTYTLRDNELVPLQRIQGDCVLHRGLCEDEQGWTYFGEYFMNPERTSVRIWRVDSAMQNIEAAYTFPAGSIRHVHGVFRDPFDPPALWAAVGDFKGECYLVMTRDRFKTITTYGDGSQIWRAVSLFFTQDHVCWLTDSNLEQNYACRMQRQTGNLQIGHEVDCSSWYGCTTREGLHIAFTTVERGPAIKRDESSVLISRDAFHWHEVYTFKKDFWRPLQVFKYGVISCPSGDLSSQDLWISGEGLVGLDGRSLRVAITENE